MELSREDKKLLVWALQCELDSIRRTIAHSEGMPSFKHYMLTKIARAEDLMHRLVQYHPP